MRSKENELQLILLIKIEKFNLFRCLMISHLLFRDLKPENILLDDFGKSENNLKFYLCNSPSRSVACIFCVHSIWALR